MRVRDVFTAYTTIKEPCVYKKVIKKSRFFGRLFPVKSMQEAQDKIEQCKKEYWDAAHNCSAVVLGARGEYTRCSDDGEPARTAGVPMLETLKQSGLTDVLAVVTRYFGGVLLGTGGLVRAYSLVVAEALKMARKTKYMPIALFEVTLPFKIWNRAEAQFAANGYVIRNIRYTDVVTAEVCTALGREEQLRKSISELTAGAARAKEKGIEYSNFDL